MEAADKGIDFHLGDCATCPRFACVGLYGVYYCLECFTRELAHLTRVMADAVR